MLQRSHAAQSASETDGRCKMVKVSCCESNSATAESMSGTGSILNWRVPMGTPVTTGTSSERGASVARSLLLACIAKSLA